MASMKFKRSRSRCAVILAALIAQGTLSTSAAKAQEVGVSAPQDTSLTIYNQNFGLVKDIRNVELKDGINYVRVEDVAAQLDPTTLNFASLTAPNSVVIREQNYQYDLMD